MKRLLAMFLVCLMTVAIVAGCGPKEEEKDPGSLIYNAVISGEPRTIDSIYSTNIISFDLLRHFMQGLTHVDETGHDVAPGMAERWEISEDKVTYTFYLRESLWSDGTPVTAHDFEFAWKKVLAPETGAPFGGNMFVIKNGQKYNAGECTADEVGVKALDDTTLQVVTEYYAPYFLTLVSTPLFMPIKQSFYEAQGENYAMEASNILSNGPWVFNEWVHQEKITMVKNEGYHSKDKVNFDTIVWHMVEDTGTTYNMFLAGELDGIGIAGVAQIQQAVQSGYEVEYTPTGTIAFIDVNHEGHPILGNHNFRMALLNGLNRTAYLESQYGGQLQAATGLNPPGTLFQGEEYIDLAGPFVEDNQIALAKEYLDKALVELGYSDVSQVPKLELLARIGEETDMAVLQEEWKKNLGIQVEVSFLPGPAIHEARGNGDFELAYAMYGYDFPYPSSLLSIYTEELKEHDKCWSPPEYNELYRKANYSLDDEEKLETLIEMERMLMDSGVVIPFFYSQRGAITSEKLHGLIRSELANLYILYAHKDN